MYDHTDKDILTITVNYLSAGPLFLELVLHLHVHANYTYTYATKGGVLANLAPIMLLCRLTLDMLDISIC